MSQDNHPGSPVCRTHPDRPADAGTCRRCGDFVCTSCVSPGTEPPRCRRCLARLADDPWVRQLPIFSVSLAVHGGLVTLMSLGFLAFGSFLFFDPTTRAQLAASGAADPEGAPVPSPELILGITSGTLAGLGAAALTGGVLQLIAGIRLFNQEPGSRGLTLLALGVGQLSCLTCYCLPTAASFLIWGLVLLFRPTVSERLAVVTRRA